MKLGLSESVSFFDKSASQSLSISIFATADLVYTKPEGSPFLIIFLYLSLLHISSCATFGKVRTILFEFYFL